jgi:hypothetical protein
MRGELAPDFLIAKFFCPTTEPTALCGDSRVCVFCVSVFMILGISMQTASQEANPPPGEPDDGKGNEHYEYEGPPMQPPQQVYVGGLEQQFQALGFRQEESSTEPSSTQTTNQNEADADEYHEEEGEDDPLKLFVGQVRRRC